MNSTNSFEINVLIFTTKKRNDLNNTLQKEGIVTTLISDC